MGQCLQKCDGQDKTRLLKTVNNIYMSNMDHQLCRKFYNQVLDKLFTEFCKKENLEFAHFFSPPIMDLLECANRDVQTYNEVVSFLNNCLNFITKALDSQELTKEQLEAFVDGLCSFAQFAIVYIIQMPKDEVAVHKAKLQGQTIPNFITEPFVAQLLQLAEKICNTFGKVTMGTLCIVSSLTHNDSVKVTKHNALYMNIFASAMNQTQDELVKQEATRVIGDYANCDEERIPDGDMKQLFGLIKDYLMDNNVNVKLKAHAICAMGDLCLSDVTFFINHISQILPPYLQIAEVSLQPDTEDLDLNEQKDRLRISLLDAFSSVAHCILDVQQGGVEMNNVRLDPNQTDQFVQTIARFLITNITNFTHTLQAEHYVDIASALTDLSEISVDIKNSVSGNYIQSLANYIHGL